MPAHLTKILSAVALLCAAPICLAGAAEDEIASLVAASDRAPMKHPRVLKGDPQDQLYKGIVEAALNERKAEGLTKLKNWLATTPVNEAAFERWKAGNVSDWNTAAGHTGRDIEAIADAAFVYFINKTIVNYNTDADLKMLHDRLNKYAPTVKDSCPGGSVLNGLYERREYIWYFALAYDLAYNGLSPEDKKLIAGAIKKCADLVLPTNVGGPARLLDTPPATFKLGSTEYNALAKIAAGLTLVRGEPEFADIDSTYLTRALQLYLPNFHNMGTEDGGYVNGSSYFTWDMGEMVLPWDIFDRVIKYPIYQKKYLINMSEFLLFTLPPDSPAGAFGDGAELRRDEDRARFGKSIMNRYFRDSSKWYVKHDSGEDQGRLQILLSPRENTSASTPPVPTAKLSMHFPDTGIAAFHTDFNSAQRLSILFRSSPRGSLNHAHADQNSFVIYNKGKVLAMDSGHYDGWDSDHTWQWAKTTKAHNAITYATADGITKSLGQEVVGGRYGSANASGKITKFNPNATNTDGTLTAPVSKVKYDIVTGDATAAYGANNVTSALRTLVFIRPSTLVVLDRLSAPTAAPKRWEYNLHTPDSAGNVSTSATAYAMKFGTDPDPTMCVTVHSPNNMSRIQTSGYFPEPQLGTNVQPLPHVWNKFAYDAASVNGLFVSVYRMDCLDGSGDNVTFKDGEANLTIDHATILMDKSGQVTVQ